MWIGRLPRGAGVNCRFIYAREIRFIYIKIFAVLFACHISTPPRIVSGHRMMTYRAVKYSASRLCKLR